MMNCKHCNHPIAEGSKHKVTNTQSALNGFYCSPECIGLRANKLLKPPVPLQHYPLGLTVAELKMLLSHYVDCEELLVGIAPAVCAPIEKVSYTPHGLVFFPNEKYLKK